MALTITELFNDATTREIGGISPDQVNLIASDLVGVQQGLNAAFPTVTDLTSLHARIIANQLSEEIATVEKANSATGTTILGTDLGQYVGRAINDIHRDIIDIAQGDPGLQAAFNPAPLPDLNTPAAPFLDNAAQTAFLTQFIQDSNHLGQAAIAIENGGFKADVSELIQQIQTFAHNANAFDQSQGGLWSARFWNELRSDGTAGTTAAALIEGLQTHNAAEINAAADQLAANASDVGSNNLKVDGGSYADVIAAAQATAVKPIGGQGGGGSTGQGCTGTSQNADGGAGHGSGHTSQNPDRVGHGHHRNPAQGHHQNGIAAAVHDRSNADPNHGIGSGHGADAGDAPSAGAHFAHPEFAHVWAF